MSAIHAEHFQPESPPMMASRPSPRATLTARLTLLSIVVSLCGVAGAWYADRLSAQADRVRLEETNKQTRLDLGKTERSFETAMNKVEASVDKMHDVMVQVLQSQAMLNRDVINLNNRIDRLDPRKP